LQGSFLSLYNRPALLQTAGMKKLFAIALWPLLCVAATNAAAQEKPYRYAPAHCDFTVTFPEEPYTTRKCAEESGRCHEVKSFTRVYSMHTTVNFRITCNASPPEMFERYNAATMDAVLRGMVDGDIVDDYETAFTVHDDVKIASLTGTGEVGRAPVIYAAQIWIGENSVFTLEGELIGQAHADSDRLFADIIASIAPVSAIRQDDSKSQDIKSESQDLIPEESESAPP
jgi:hypothetical protein